MKKSLFSVLLFLLLVPCICAAATPSQERDIRGFSDLDVSGSFAIRYTQSDRYRVYVDTADAVVLGKTTTRLVGSSLVIEYDGVRTSRIVIYVESPTLHNVHISGSACFTAETPINDSFANYQISGSGSVVLRDLTVGNANISKSGSGVLRVSGTLRCDTLIADLSGAGSMTLNNISASVASISSNGTCGCTINGLVAVRKLVGTMSGAGSFVINGDVRAKETVRLEMLGAGSVSAKGHVYTDLLYAKMAGTGSIAVPDVEAGTCETVLRGIGSIKLGGTTDRITRDMVGFGRVNTDNLTINQKD